MEDAAVDLDGRDLTVGEVSELLWVLRGAKQLVVDLVLDLL